MSPGKVFFQTLFLRELCPLGHFKFLSHSWKVSPFLCIYLYTWCKSNSTLLHPACVACHRWKWKAIMDMRLCKNFCTNICAHQNSLKHISPHFYQSWRADFYLLPLTGGHHRKYKRRNLFIQNFAPSTSIWWEWGGSDCSKKLSGGTFGGGGGGGGGGGV